MRLLKLLSFIFILFVTSTIAYRAGEINRISPITSPPKIVEKPLTCPYIVKDSRYKDYFKVGYETEIIGKPQIYNKPEIRKINKPFNKKEFEEGITKLSPDYGWGYRDFDVDGDGKKETIVNADQFMNHRPHIAMIVKNGNIIFEARGGSIWIDEAIFGKGFTLSQEINRIEGEYEKIRFIPKEGGFMPIWTQKVCYIQFE